MRRVALRLAEEIRRVHPLLAKYLHLPEGETWRTIEEHYFAATKWLNDPGYEPRRNEAREGLL
jgi:hypothetical protein